MQIQGTRANLIELYKRAQVVKATIQAAHDINHQNYDEEVRDEFAGLLLNTAKELATAEMIWSKLERAFPSSKMFSFVQTGIAK
jgi:hypothetical protein